MGSIVGTHQDVVDVFALHARGMTRVERQDADLDDVNEAIAAVLDGSAGAARTVFQIRRPTPALVPDEAGLVTV